MESNYIENYEDEYVIPIDKKGKNQRLLENFQSVINSLRDNYAWSNRDIMRELGIPNSTFYKYMSLEKAYNFNNTTRTIMKSLILKYEYGGFTAEPIRAKNTIKASNKTGKELKATLTRTGKSLTNNFIRQALKAEEDTKYISGNLEWWEDMNKLIARAPKGISITIGFAQ